MGNNDSKPRATSSSPGAPGAAVTTTSTSTAPAIPRPAGTVGLEDTLANMKLSSVDSFIPLLAIHRSNAADTELIIKGIIARLDKYPADKNSFVSNMGFLELASSVTANLKDSGVCEWGARCIIVASATDDVSEALMDQVLDSCGKVLLEIIMSQMQKAPDPCQWSVRALNLIAAGSPSRKDALSEMGACEVVVRACTHQIDNEKVAEWGTRCMIVLMDSHENNTKRIGAIGGAEIAGKLLAKHVHNPEVIQWAARCLILQSYTHTSVALKICSSGLLKCVATALKEQNADAATEWVTRLIIVLSDSTDKEVNDKVHESMGSNGVCSALVTSLTNHLDNATVCNWNVKAILILATANAKAFGSGGVAQAISQCISRQVNSDETVEYALRAAVVLADVDPNNKELFGKANYIQAVKSALMVHKNGSPKIVEWAVRSLIVIVNESKTNQSLMASSMTNKTLCETIDACIGNDAILEWSMRCMIVTANGNTTAQSNLGAQAGPCLANTLRRVCQITDETRRSTVLEWTSRAIIVLINDNSQNGANLGAQCGSALIECLSSDLSFSMTSIEWSVRALIVFSTVTANISAFAEQNVSEALYRQLVFHAHNVSVVQWVLVAWTVLGSNSFVKASLAPDRFREQVISASNIHVGNAEISQYATEVLALCDAGKLLPAYVPRPQVPTNALTNLSLGGPQTGNPNTLALPYNGDGNGMPMATAVVSINGTADVNYAPAVVVPPTPPLSELNKKDIDTMSAFFNDKCGLGMATSTELATKFVNEHKVCTPKMMKRKLNSGALDALLAGLDSDSIDAIKDELIKIE